MAARVRARAKTAARGYGGDHQSEQQRRLARWKPGDPCARCGQPMLQRWLYQNGRRVSAIHLGHTPDRTAWTGLEHARCNLSEAATRGNRMRGQKRAVAKSAPPVPAAHVFGSLRTSRRW